MTGAHCYGSLVFDSFRLHEYRCASTAVGSQVLLQRQTPEIILISVPDGKLVKNRVHIPRGKRVLRVAAARLDTALASKFGTR